MTTLENVLEQNYYQGNIAMCSSSLVVHWQVISICFQLASRCVGLIPRAIAAFEKLGKTVSGATEEEKEALSQHAKELTRILKNPRQVRYMLCYK